MENGKLPPHLLKEMLEKYTGYRRDDVKLAGRLGEDCTFIDMGQFTLAVSSDPVTAAEKDIGKIAFNINMNDMATSGAEGIGLMVTILLPSGTSFGKVSEIMSEIHEEALKHRMQILGGHTEVTDAVNRIVVSVTVLGRVRSGDEIISSGLKVGDTLLVSKELCIEGTLLILNDFRDRVTIDDGAAESLLERLKDSLSVAEEGRIGGRLKVHSLHDITEGGVLGAIYEVVHGSGLGCEIDGDALPFMDETISFCRELGIDPLRLISSGSMLIGTDDPESFIRESEKEGIAITRIGTVTEAGSGLYIEERGRRREIAQPTRDEIYRLYEGR